jgi:pyruvate/2-oxoglutarate/acetoin dehydrogenase E1 component
MKAAIRDDNPVMFCEHVSLGKEIGPVPDEDYVTPVGEANILREGSDATVIATGTLLKTSLKVADQFGQYGISIEVIDPRTLVPLDKVTILESVAKTGRLVVADETHLSCGVASEISAIVAEEAFSSLKAPIKRVATLDVPIPFSPPMEKYVLPQEVDISRALEEILE